jgi:hypothetical protein
VTRHDATVAGAGDAGCGRGSIVLSGRTGEFQCGTVGLPLPAGGATDFDMGYSQSEFFVDLCVNVLVRPTRISPRASQGPQGRRVVPFGCARQGPDRRLRTAVSSADRAESLAPRLIGAYHHRRTPCLCVWV